MKKSAQVVLINEEGLVLAVSRKTDHNDFGLPGGKVDPEDADEIAAAIRETKEETGLDIYDLELIFAMHKNGYMGYTYLAKYSGEIKHNEPHVVKWVLFDTIMKGSFGKFNTLVSESLIDLGVEFNQDESIPGTINPFKIGENNFGTLLSYASLFCPYCNTEQADHPENIIRNDNRDSYECDECGKEFGCSKTEEVIYYSYK